MTRAKKVGFSQTCTEATVPPKLRTLNAADHPATPSVNHSATHRVLIIIPKWINKGDMEKALRYESYASAAREVDFIHQELTEYIQVGYIVVFPWNAFTHLKVLWISSVAYIPQEGRNPCLVFISHGVALTRKSLHSSPMRQCALGGY